MEDSWRSVHRAREEFLSEGILRGRLATAVRPEVLASWGRSRLSGASSETVKMPVEEGSPHSSLCAAAEPVLARLAERMSGLHAGVLLADRNARIIRRWAPESSILPQMDRVGSAAGSSASESRLGTNGIGTVAEERRARMVVGPEHYASILTTFTCVGAPIRHPLTRKFAGVVTLNSGLDAASPLLVPLMTSTAQEIEQRLLEQASQRERMLLDTFLTRNRGGGACAVVGEDVLMASPRAARLLEGVDHVVLWQQVSEAVSVRRFLVQVEGLERVVEVRCSPLMLDGRLAGALLAVEADVDADFAQPALQARPVSDATASRTRAPRPAGPPAAATDAWSTGRELLPGRSAAWGDVLRAAASQVAKRTPLTVIGEPGTGKLSLVRALCSGRGLPLDPGRVLDCAKAVEDRVGWLEGVRRALAEDAGCVVLRHLDTLDGPLAGSVSAVVATAATDPAAPRLLATADQLVVWPDSSAHRRLLDQLTIGQIEIPALRERREDISGLVLEVAAREAPDWAVRFSPPALLALTRAHWPGNVRQLESVVRGLVATAAGREVTVAMLPHEFEVYARRRELSLMEQVELDAIMSAVTRAKGNKVAAAKRLGISRSTLYRKMRTYKLDPDRQFF